MACPFFAPQRRLDPGAWTASSQAAFGRPVFGFCHALSGTSFAPPEEHQRELCNRGYARGLCAHFPGSGAADAVRFPSPAIAAGVCASSMFSKRTTPRSLMETLNFRPPIFKPAIFRPAAAPADDLLLRQARAFVESYLKSVADSKIPAQ